jgi:hypothetical protein
MPIQIGKTQNIIIASLDCYGWQNTALTVFSLLLLLEGKAMRWMPWLQ